MHPITFPLEFGQQNSDIANLHQGLRLLLGNQIIQFPLEPQFSEKVFSEEERELSYGNATAALIGIFQRQVGLRENRRTIDEATAEAFNQWLGQFGALNDSESEQRIVKGTVRLADSSPVAGVIVRAFDKDLRSEQRLGRTTDDQSSYYEITTDQFGYYEISYTRDQFNRAEKQTADLVVKAIELIPAAVEQFRNLSISPILRNAPLIAVIDLVISTDVIPVPSEYERFIRTIEPLLQGTSLVDLREDEEDNLAEGKFQDISFLAGETEINPEYIAFLVVAARLARRADLYPEVFYGLFRQNLPTDLSALLSQNPEIQRRALEISLRDNIIPARFKDELDSILQRLQQLIVEQAFEEPINPDETTLLALLSTSLPDATLQREFLTAYVQHQGEIADFWKDLRNHSTLGNSVDTLQFTLQLGALTNNYLPLVQHIQQQQITSLPELARFSETDWLNIVRGQGNNSAIGFPSDIPGKDDTEKSANYAKAISQIVEDAAPTTFMAYRLQQDDQGDRTGLRTFMAQAVLNPDIAEKFDIRTTYLEQYLTQHPNLIEQAADPEKLKAEIKGLQRLSKVASRYSQIRALQDAGFDSAHSISQASLNTLMLQHGDALGGATQTKIIHERASQASAMALNLLANYSPTFNNTNLAAVPSQAVDRIEGIPNWQTLFGSLDLCACEHCKSVYSPAAYYVDALKFLKERNLVDQEQSRRDAAGRFTDIVYQKNGTQTRTAKHVLFDRRPDLGEIELTCENTNTPVPYVDLVNEVLENAIAPFPAFAPFTISTTLENTLNTRTVSPELKAAFTPALSDFAVITVKTKGKRWTIDEPAYTYTIRKESDRLHVTARSLQTNSTAQELSANPQYINAKAYEPIRTAVYPWSLPFDLWWEESRIYLEHLGVSRQQLMETYFRGDRATLLNNPAIAAEYLGISPFEWQIITNGRTIQLATTTNLDSLSGLQPVDGVTPVLEDWVLVKDQTTGVNQGIYIVGNEAWQRIKHEFNSLTLVTIQKGTANQGKVWLMAVDKTGAVTVKPQPAWTFWGLAENGNFIPDPIKGDLERTKQAGWLEVLQNVQRFLERANLTYTELLDLLQTNFINSDRTIQIQAIPIDPITEKPVPLDCCDPEKLILTNLSEAKLHQMHRFIRLWRRLGWTIPELDKAITILKPSGLVSAFVIRLSHIQRLHDEFHIPILTLINWWGAIDTAQYIDYQSTDLSTIPSLYSQLFRNKSITNPLNPAFTEDSARLSGKLSDSANVATITAAFGITAENFSLLLNDANVIPKASSTSSNPDDKLNLVNLSRLYRHATLAKALSLSIRDYLAARQLIGDPFASTTDTILFIEKVDKIRSSGFTIAELMYLLNHSYTEASGVAPTEEAIALILTDIRSELQKIAAENTFTDATSDPTGELTQKKLAAILDVPDLEKAIALIKGSWKDATAKAFIDQHFAKFLNRDEAKAQLVDSTTFTNPEERYLYVLKPLLAYLRRALSESLVKQKLTEALKLEAGVIDRLLTQHVKSPADSGKGAIAEFLDPAFTGSTATISPTANVFKTFTLLHKIAIILTKFRVTQNQLIWLFTYAAEVGWLDLKTLPITQTTSPAQFGAWERLVDLMQLRDTLPLGEALLNEIFSRSRNLPGDGSTAQNSLLQLLSQKTQWSLEGLTFLTTIGFNFTFPDAYKDERALTRLVACFALQKRLGISTQQGYFWSTPSVTEDTARSIKQTVKAKYEETQWLTLAKPLRDILREKQRSALVAYLVAHPDSTRQQNWKDANGLYEHFLIDVEMSPCQMTSRIKQAISSVQLFVQRCLMNLERQVLASAEIDEKWRQWKWMKNYRVWEANRKVFLYPENWIEPELRDDKSPFFKDLENELLQNDLTTDTAETAFLHYLEKLDAVARLEIVGMYHQEESSVDGLPAVDILHVFGRTSNTPHVYYYRRCIDKNRWTAWEKVDVDIEGDYLLPLIWNRRLYLFWTIFTEKQEEQPVTVPNAGEPMPSGTKHWEIQLAWSEYKNKGWSAKKISDVSIKTSEPSDKYDKTSFSFKGIVSKEGHLTVRCYKPTLTLGIGSSQKNSNSPFSNPVTIQLPTLTEYVEQLPFKGFYFSGCNSSPSTLTLSSKTVRAPRGTQLVGMMFTSVFNSDHKLYLPAYEVDIPVLNEAYIFRLLTAHQSTQFTSQRPFFFQDEVKTFFVIPEDSSLELASGKTGLEQINPGVIKAISNHYFSKELQPIAIEVTDNSLDAFVQERSSSTEPSSNSVFSDTISLSTARINTPAVQAENRDVNFSGSAELQKIGTINDALQKSTIDEILTVSSRYGDILSRGRANTWRRFLFQNFYHPYVCTFIQELSRNGIDGLLQRITQTDPLRLSGASTPFNFETTYVPQSVVKEPYPLEEVDFSSSGSYSQYNWELFFHVPLIIADRLSKNQRFEEAQKWFHYIFNPTDTSSYSSPQKYWQNGYFFKTSREDYQREQIQNLLRQIAEGNSELAKQVDEWRAHPFQPHLIAQMRTTAYQKTVVMKYIDNLISWGDQLFRRDTIESINEATQLYILAAEILGRRPQSIPPRAVPQVQTYNTLEPRLGNFSDALVEIENFVPASTEISAPTNTQPSLNLQVLYFCIPKNDKLLGYWDIVGDRLFKIRHCMNIEGVTRQLPLFEPPIDPALLVRATAAGIDISSALNDINAALPHYRFNIMVQKATELCAELKSLGAALLSALEKRDAEALALLRSQHEIDVLKAVRQVREQQIKEAQETLESLKKSREITQFREAHYASLLNGISKTSVSVQAGPIDVSFSISTAPINQHEATHLMLVGGSLLLQAGQAATDLSASVLHLIPDLKAGSPTTVGLTFGGSNIGSAIQAFGSSLGIAASMMNTAGSAAATLGSYIRRAEEWTFQRDIATKELLQLDKQIAAAEIRVAIAQQELKNHDLQIENAKAVDAYMQDKFTNQQLYDWMVGQISSIYFQSYQLAYDVAKRAERSYRFELGLQDSNFIQFGYWDSLKKGLLAGERLHHDLKRMEIAYLDQHKREYEITKHISLATLDPIALLQLKQTGNCFISIPEVLFDLDCPGHYMRRIKSVSMTIPCVTGPYTSVNCTLTLVKSSIRQTNSLASGKYVYQDPSDSRFIDITGAIQSVVTSSAQNDTGLFEPNLRDERYLPFEGSGAISDWQLELPKDFPQFDHDTILDVILHMRYTAREGGDLLRSDAIIHLKEQISTAQATGTVRLFSIRHEFPTEWAKFRSSKLEGATERAALSLNLREEHYPFWSRGRLRTVEQISFFATNDVEISSTPDGTENKVALKQDQSLGNLKTGKLAKIPLQSPIGQLTLFLNNNSLEDLWLAINWGH